MLKRGMTPLIASLQPTLFLPALGMRVVFYGGPFDGETRTINRDAEHVSFGLHREPDWSLIDCYDRTIRLDGQGQVIFQYVAHALHSHRSQFNNCASRILTFLGGWV